MANVLISVPVRAYHGRVSPQTERCIALLRARTGHAVQFDTVGGQQISQNSLGICEKFLEGNWDYLLYTGDDIIFPPWALDRLMGHNKDFVSGVCTWKTPPYMVPVGKVGEDGKFRHILIRPEHVHNNVLLEVDGVGSGFILVKRRVLEGIMEWLRDDVYPRIPDEIRWVSPLPFFPVTYDPKHAEVIGSDFAFSRMAKEAGFDIHMDCGLVCRHRWEGEYDITDHWAWLQKYGFNKEPEHYYGHNPGYMPVEEDSVEWGPDGPPVPITMTSVGNLYHLQEHVAPITGGLLEPITAEGRPATEVGYVYGFHIGDDESFKVYAAWCKRFKRVLIQWAGSDVLNMDAWMTPERMAHLNHPRFVHLAVDPRLIPALKEKFENVHLAMPPTRYDYGVMALPKKFAVAVYYPKERHDFHYGDVLKEVIEKLPDVQFYLYHLHGGPPEFEYPNMAWLGNLGPQEYAQMLMGTSCMLRLSKHDGRPFSIMEAALAGRRFITNFDMPGTHRVGDVPTADEVVAKIEEIRKETAPDRETSDVYREANSHRYFKDLLRDLAGLPQKMSVMAPGMDKRPYDYKEYFEYRYGQGPRGAGGPLPGGVEAKWTTHEIAQILRNFKCDSVLDVGCGSMVRWDKLPVKEYTGVDISPTAIQYAQERFPDATFFVADVTSDTLPRADAVVSIDVMQHIRPEDFKAVQKRLFGAAKKVCIIKTSVGITPGYYQFDHRWNGVPQGWKRSGEMKVPESDGDVSRLFVFERVKDAA